MPAEPLPHANDRDTFLERVDPMARLDALQAWRESRPPAARLSYPASAAAKSSDPLGDARAALAASSMRVSVCSAGTGGATFSSATIPSSSSP